MVCQENQNQFQTVKFNRFQAKKQIWVSLSLECAETGNLEYLGFGASIQEAHGEPL